MRPNIWIDVCVRRAGQGIDHAPARHTRSGILLALHDIFSDNPQRFAIAVPRELRGTGVRVFMSNAEDAELLKRELSHNRFILTNAEVYDAHKVPEDFDGTWTTWMRYRTGGDHPDQRKRKMLYARRMHYEWFEMVSLSTGGRRFSLHVRPTDGTKPEGECLPNSFGLASTEQPFALPDVSLHA